MTKRRAVCLAESNTVNWWKMMLHQPVLISLVSIAAVVLFLHQTHFRWAVDAPLRYRYIGLMSTVALCACLLSS